MSKQSKLNRINKLELKFSNLCKKIEETENSIFWLEEHETELAIMGFKNSFGNKYHNKYDRLENKRYTLEEKQSEVQDKIELLMNSVGLSY